MATDLDILRHKEWLGLLQPVGLVVSPPALIKAQAVIDRGTLVDLQERLQTVISRTTLSHRKDETVAWIENFPVFTQQVLGWRDEDLVGATEQAAIPDQLTVALPNYGETLRPTYAVRDPDSNQWVLLIQAIAPGLPFDEDDPAADTSHGWRASIQSKFERLLRETGVFAGLLVNGTDLRLVYAPKGESSGYLTFPVQAMTEVPGRLILGALDLLLGEDRLFNVPENQRLQRLLADSRSYQAEVSTKLADQVLDALWELLRGFQAANAAANGKLLSAIAETEPQHIYGGLIATLMRLVFLLYAEDEGLMPDDEVYQRNYAVSGLYEKLREDVGNYPDTMDQRYGAWSALLSLFRLVYDGGGATEEYLPARRGQLFDPDEYPYLEGRPQYTTFQKYGKIEAPRIADGVVYRMLDKLLILDGERLSYRSLDVEQIGSVYEAIMGYEVQVAHGRSIAVRSKDVVVNVDAILATNPADRAKLLKDAECDLKGSALNNLKDAKTVEAVVAAIARRVSPRTPNLLPMGGFFLQPGEERRRSGSHYTPRKLTQPIVEKTLEPVLGRLGEHPAPEQLLELKVCDLAMGSAAFLVEACRQLADRLVEAWNYHGKPADLPDAVEDVVVARRLVAQQCLYGVDKNPFAVNLAKLSLWLVTLAKDLPFTFLDHALKCGDSLVGLTRSQIGSFGANAVYEPTFFEDHKQLIKQSATKAMAYRQKIQRTDTRTDGDAEQKHALLQDVDRTLEPARLTAKVAVASFFTGANAKQRQQNREELGGKLIGYEKGLVSESEIQAVVAKLTTGKKAVLPFNWELEFPEVFDRKNPGFDAIVGNPPFLGGRKISTNLGLTYFEHLVSTFPDAGNLCDLVGYFFRQAFMLIRNSGTIGLIATNTIAQGDTRKGSLAWICKHGGVIYTAYRRTKWTGIATVLISLIHIAKRKEITPKFLDGQESDNITAYLFHSGGNDEPEKLLAMKSLASQGSQIYGKGFLFDDSDEKSNPVVEMERIISQDLRYKERVYPFVGGQEINESSTHKYTRHVVYLSDLKNESDLNDWSELKQIVEAKVKPERDLLKNNSTNNQLKRCWWAYQAHRPDLYAAMKQMDRVLVSCIVTKHLSLVFMPTNMIFSHKTVVFLMSQDSAFCTLQGRIHEVFARFFSCKNLDLLSYSPSNCFETFPFPPDWETNPALEVAGKAYYEFRADLMVRNNEGLTATYNRFHDPNEVDPDILKLRELHAQMDRAVLNAYGWHDISTDCEFLLDYEDEETEGSKRKKPWRYRWPEEAHDEVLARLLKLNQERYKAEILGGRQAEGKVKGNRRSAKGKSSTSAEMTQVPTIPGLDP